MRVAYNASIGRTRRENRFYECALIMNCSYRSIFSGLFFGLRARAQPFFFVPFVLSGYMSSINTSKTPSHYEYTRSRRCVIETRVIVIVRAVAFNFSAWSAYFDVYVAVRVHSVTNVYMYI